MPMPPQAPMGRPTSAPTSTAPANSPTAVLQSQNWAGTPFEIAYNPAGMAQGFSGLHQYFKDNPNIFDGNFGQYLQSLRGNGPAAAPQAPQMPPQAQGNPQAQMPQLPPQAPMAQPPQGIPGWSPMQRPMMGPPSFAPPRLMQSQGFQTMPSWLQNRFSGR